MEHEQDDDVYDGALPDEDYMESEFDPSADAEAATESKSQELESMKKRLQEIEEEAGALREMQAKVENEMGTPQEDSSGTSVSQAEKEEVDARSIYVGNNAAKKLVCLQKHIACCQWNNWICNYLY